MKHGRGKIIIKGKRINNGGGFWNGIASLFGAVTPVVNETVRETIYYNDNEAIRSDWGNVGRDIQKSMDQIAEEECV